jgi:hypothetical protein
VVEDLAHVPLPEWSLGWEILRWCSDNLAQPDGANKGDKWRFSKEQARFVIHFYAVDQHGKFMYRRGLLGRVKGWGKSPLLAALCCAELLGPVVFSHFGSDGKPVGKPQPSPWVQIAATSEAQTDNTMDLVIEMLLNGEARENYWLDIGKTRILCNGGKLEPVTAGSTSREGNRPTFVVLDETHLWVKSNHGDKLAAVIRRNLGKFSGRSVETTNAPAPGEQSVAELSLQAAEEGRPGLLVDYRKAPDEAPAKVDKRDEDYEEQLEKRREALRYAYGDSRWVDLQRIEEEMDDPATTEADARRFYFNQIVRGNTQWLDPERWKLIELNVPFEEISPKDRIALGFDGSINDDTTALIGCRLSDGHIFTIHIWAKPEGARDWEVPFADVDMKVRKILEDYRVVWMYADPAHYQDIIGRWALDFEDTIFEYWTNRAGVMSRAIERFETAVNHKLITHDLDPMLTAHALNAQYEEKPGYGKLLKKEFRGSSRKIDGIMAAVLALEARADAIEDGRDSEGPNNTVYTF